LLLLERERGEKVKGKLSVSLKAMLVVVLLVGSASAVMAFLSYTATVSTPYEVAPSISASVVNAQSGNGPCTTSWTANAASIACGPASVAAAGDNFTVDVSISGASSTSGTWESSADTTCGTGTSGTFVISSGLASLTCTVTAASGGGSSNIILDFS
jgi:hypothetical protein